MSEKHFTCGVCGADFTVPEAALAKYPGWKPQKCLRCRPASGAAAGGRGAARPKPSAPSRPAPDRSEPPPGPNPEPLPTGDPDLDRKLRVVLERHRAGPHEGVFTDGGCSGNPGPGGWGAVRVQGGKILAQQHGRDPDTTNNRMELMALIAGYKMLEPDEEVTLWSDSQLCVNTINEWAARWEKNGWRRKDGPIKNLELVKEAYALSRARPKARLCWVQAHNGSRWNEYVDTLSTGELR